MHYVTEVVGAMLKVVPRDEKLHFRLVNLRDSIFLETPEDRPRYTRELFEIIQEEFPEGGKEDLLVWQVAVGEIWNKTVGGW